MQQAENTLGIDEAGRGPILGPMVMACVVLSNHASAQLQAQGVIDSKEFGTGYQAHQRRLALVPSILQHAAHVDVRVLSVAEIDERVFRGELNLLEQEIADSMIAQAPSVQAIVADGVRLFGPLRTKYPHLRAVNHAESIHVAVAAASVLAKTRRDQEWETIVKRYRPEFGNLIGPGLGYANSNTKRFLRAYCAKYKQLPPEGRRSWPWDFVSDLLAPEVYQRLVRQLTLRSQVT